MNTNSTSNDTRFTDKWRDNFKKNVKAIQLEYNSFLLNKNIEDYYSLESNEKDDMLSLHFNDVHGLPRMIMSAIELAFIESMPDKV